MTRMDVELLQKLNATELGQVVRGELQFFWSVADAVATYREIHDGDEYSLAESFEPTIRLIEKGYFGALYDTDKNEIYFVLLKDI